MPVANSKQCGYKILFSYKSRGQLKLKANIILALNKKSQKTDIKSKI